METPTTTSCARAQPAPLETLPLHLFECICTFLPQRSLLDLSLASRLCAQAAAPQQFSRIRLNIHGIEKLHHDLERWTAILSRGGRFRHVRRVVAVGYLRNDYIDQDDDDEDDDPEADRASERDTNSEVGSGRDRHTELDAQAYNVSDDEDDESDGDTVSDAWSDRDRYSELDAQTYNDSDSESGDDAPGRTFLPTAPPVEPWSRMAENKAWMPFARFLAQIPGLKDLVYSLSHHLPRCVLDVLHQHHPRCRLHVRIFGLRSLYQDPDNQHAMDPDELALASSPCLYSIHLRYLSHDFAGHFNFNLDAIGEMVAGYAPNLKRVHLHVLYPAQRDDLAAGHANTPWIGFPSPAATDDQPSPDPARPPLARLETLATSGWSSGPEQLSLWTGRTDFSCLRHFDFGCRLSPDDFDTLASMAAAGEFRCLRSLGLRVAAENFRLDNLAALDVPARRFLLAVPPLKTLRLAGHFGTITLAALLARHGPTLRTLHLLPDRKKHAEFFTLGCSKDHIPLFYDTAAVIRQLAAACPALRALALVVQRHGGGPAEVAAYRALAALPRLERASLFLDCRALPGAVGVVTTAAEEVEAEALAESGWVVEVLRNCAVDEPLARAIFAEIRAARGGAPLEWLWVEPVVPVVTLHDLEKLGRWLGRSWACEMRSGGRLEVREMKAKDVLEWGSKEWVFRGELTQLEDCYVDEWNSLWPRSAVRDWRYQWSSFPLVSGESGEVVGGRGS